MDVYLIYINELGRDYQKQKQYEFIFSKTVDVREEEWYMIPSSGRSVPPTVGSINMVGLLKNSDLELELVQNSDYFGVIDAVDGIIALGWENYLTDGEETIDRTSFHFGEHLECVVEKLKNKGLRLINEEIKYEFS
jgi:hypothetical protein